MTSWWLWVSQGRRDRHLSQAELAQLVGRSEAWIKALEQGRVDLSLEDEALVGRVADAVGVDRIVLSYHVRLGEDRLHKGR